MEKRRLTKYLLLLSTMFLFGIMLVSEAHAIENVSQSEISNGTAETRNTSYSAGTIIVEGGNITEHNISKLQQTQWWQGIWGTVNVNLTLNDAAGNTFYNWTEANASGEIYFYNGSLEDFAFNESSDDNVTFAQTNLGWADSPNVDNLQNTYNNTFGHEDFIIDQAIPVQINSTAAVNLDGGHNCTMVWQTNLNHPVWAALLMTDLTVFNGQTADYQCLLPTRTSGGQETFYVYSELT